MTNITITLEVDTATLQNNTSPLDVYKSCKVDGDSNSQSKITTVHVGDDVTWVGVSKNGSDTVEIKQIIHGGGRSAFNNYPLTPNPATRPDVKGNVANKWGTTDPNEKYKISFTTSAHNRTFILDPILRVNF